MPFGKSEMILSGLGRGRDSDVFIFSKIEAVEIILVSQLLFTEKEVRLITIDQCCCLHGFSGWSELHNA